MTGQLLSPSESHAFQSFLSSIDYPDSHVSQEWSMYAPTEHTVDEPSRVRGKEALTKATKDLMALDATQGARMQSQSQSHQQFDYSQGHRRTDQLQYDHDFRHNQAPFQHRSQAADLSGLAYLKQTQSRSLTQHSQNAYSHRRHALGITVAPSRTITSPPPSAPTSYTPHHQLQFSSSQSRSSLVTKHTIAHEQFGRSSSHKRPRLSPGPSTSPSSTSSLLLPLPRLSQPHHQSVSPPLQYTHPTHKPTLLSPSQKKANHIQSEQKRRANIRRGYEALCETVPALKDAIKEEEVLASGAASGNGDVRSNAAKGRGKRGRGRGKLEDGEKVDGRAGPRSENVVLSKTIEYINELLAERAALLTRLNRAKDALPPGHLTSTANGQNGTGRHSVPLWEREWKGGEGKTDGGEEEEDDFESS